MSNNMLGALIDNLFETPHFSETARRNAAIASHLTRVVLWLLAILAYGLAIGYLQQDTPLARAGLVLVGVTMLPAAVFVLLIGPEWARSTVLHRARARRR